MQKINFQNLPNTTTPINATNLNAIQTNVEDVFNGNVAMGNINTTGVNINNTPIIESGSNANGNYIKYEDGTLIQWNKVQVSDQAISNAYGSLFQGTRNITFPIAFVGNLPTVQCSEFQWGSGASWGSCVGNATTLTSSQLRGFDIASRTEGTLCNISWLAIGKWK